MRAYTVYQPYAYATVAGLKHYETRTRKTNIRGRVAVHAGKKRAEDIMAMTAIPPDAALYYGAVIGTVEITDCVPAEELVGKLTFIEEALGDFSPGRFAYKLENPVMFDKPILARGKQGWWNWEGSAE